MDEKDIFPLKCTPFLFGRKKVSCSGHLNWIVHWPAAESLAFKGCVLMAKVNNYSVMLSKVPIHRCVKKNS